jgi:hypothetical protein
MSKNAIALQPEVVASCLRPPRQEEETNEAHRCRPRWVINIRVSAMSPLSSAASHELEHSRSSHKGRGFATVTEGSSQQRQPEMDDLAIEVFEVPSRLKLGAAAAATAEA